MKYNLGKELDNIEVDEDKLNEIKELLGLETEWEPKVEEEYWTVNYHLGSWKIDSYIWDNDRRDNHAFKSGVVFKTEEQARQEVDRRNFLQQMELDFKANSEPIDWEDIEQSKYSIRYWHDKYMVIITKSDTLQFNNLYTTNKEWLEQYIKDNEENIKKYYFGIEE